MTKACALAASETFDVAILDVNLAGEMVSPVARILRGRHIPSSSAPDMGSRRWMIVSLRQLKSKPWKAASDARQIASASAR